MLTIDDDLQDDDPEGELASGGDCQVADQDRRCREQRAGVPVGSPVASGPVASRDRLDRSEPAVVLDTLPNKMLLVETRDGARTAVHVAGPMRMGIIRLVPGDSVRIEKSPFDSSKGRIVGVDGGHPVRVRRAPNESRRDSYPETAP